MRTAGAPAGLAGEAALRSMLEAVLARSTADETEAALTTAREAVTRFAHNSIHQNMAEADAELVVRAAFGRRLGLASTNDLSPAGIERVVAEACALARHQPENADWLGLTDPAELPPPAERPQPVQAYDEAVAAMSPEARGRTVAGLCAAARAEGWLASGAYSTNSGEAALLNSHGLWAYAPSTRVDLTFVLEEPGEQASAYGHAAGWRLDQVDAAALRAEALAQARRAREPRPLPAGEYPVVLQPYAVASMLEALAEAGLGAQAVQDERSWMNQRLGVRCLSPRLTLCDDAYDPDGVPQAFDCEGVPKQRVPLVVAGVPTMPVYDRLTAAREPGRTSTGHAQPFDDEDWDGPLPENLSLAPGEQSLDELVAGLDRGLLVTRFWYVNVAAPHDCDVTGTTRDGVWWVERGEVAYPVRNLRFDQSLVAALAGVRAVGRDRRTVEGYFGGIHRVPVLALDSFRFIDP
jgi:predicted Zn-dependent protease